MLVERLCLGGAAGLAIHPGASVPAYFDVMASVADGLRFPLIRLRPDVSYIQIFRAIYGELLNRQAAILKRSEVIFNRFTELIVKGRDSRAIAESLYEVIGDPVLVLDARLSRNLAWGGPFSVAQSVARRMKSAQVAQGIVERASDSGPMAIQVAEGCEDGGRKTGREPLRLYVTPVRPGGELARFLVVAETRKPIDEIALMAMKHAVTALSFSVLRERAVLETERRLTTNILDDLLLGAPVPPDVIIERGDALGMDLRRRRVVFFVSPLARDETDESPILPESGAVTRRREAILRAVESAMRHIDHTAVVAGRADGVVVLPSFMGNMPLDEVRLRARDLAAGLEARLNGKLGGIPLLIGVGALVADTFDLKWSYESARWVIGMAEKIGRLKGVMEFDAMGVYRLAAGPLNQDLLNRFVEDTLSTLQREGGAEHADLLHTLEAFLDCRESFVATAEKLYVHPNTVKYRIDKVRQMFPLDPLANPEFRLALHLALKLRFVQQR